MIGLETYRAKLEQMKGKRDRASQQLEETESKISEAQRKSEDIESAQVIIQVVAKATQEELQYKISELVSLALEAVLKEPYKLNLDFEIRRGKTEADLTFSRKNSEDKIDPMNSTGGGAVDVASFGLRVASWSLERPRSRAVLIMDEPFRFLSRDLQGRAANILSEISKSLNIQMIAVTHEQTLIASDHIDRTFDVMMAKGRSKVERLEI